MKHILITDSGVGGLSVVAYAERFVRERGFTEPVRLTFANAAPENDYGYNSMKTRQEKLETFQRFLRNVTERFGPDSIYVACNTLSVLLPEVRSSVPIKGIVETAVELIVDAMKEDSVAMIFGTQTTIDSGVYPRMLEARGIPASRIVSQACPGLADTISEDREGERTATEIRKWVDAAVSKKQDRNAPAVVCLACTHYGYRKEMFEAALPGAKVINPNESATGDLFDRTGAVHEAEVEFVTRYRIPEATVEALSFFLSNVSAATVRAMRQFVHAPDLF